MFNQKLQPVDIDDLKTAIALYYQSCPEEDYCDLTGAMMAVMARYQQDGYGPYYAFNLMWRVMMIGQMRYDRRFDQHFQYSGSNAVPDHNLITTLAEYPFVYGAEFPAHSFSLALKNAQPAREVEHV